MGVIGPMPGVPSAPKSTSAEPLKSMALEPAIMALGHLNTRERVQFMKMNRDNRYKIHRLATQEKNELVKIKDVLSRSLNPATYESEIRRLNHVIESPEFNRTALSFEDRQKFFQKQIYDIFNTKVRDPAFSDLRSNRDLMLNLVKENSLLLQHADVHLKNDAEFVREAVKHNGMALLHASEDLKKDRETVLLAVSQRGLALQFASPALREDPEIVSIAVSQNGLALAFATGKARKDPEIVKTALAQNGLALQFVEEELLRKNPSIVKIALRQNGLALQYASETMQNIVGVVSVAVAQNGNAIRFASDERLADLEIARIAVRQNPTVVYRLPRELQDHPEIQAIVNE